jgi:hypothetical protein
MDFQTESCKTVKAAQNPGPALPCTPMEISLISILIFTPSCRTVVFWMAAIFGWRSGIRQRTLERLFGMRFFPCSRKRGRSPNVNRLARCDPGPCPGPCWDWKGFEIETSGPDDIRITESTYLGVPVTFPKVFLQMSKPPLMFFDLNPFWVRMRWAIYPLRPMAQNKM